MGFGGISIWQLLIILAIVVLLFGTKKLKSIGSDLGSAVKGFKKAVNDDPVKAEEDQDTKEAKEDQAEAISKSKNKSKEKDNNNKDKDKDKDGDKGKGKSKDKVKEDGITDDREKEPTQTTKSTKAKKTETK